MNDKLDPISIISFVRPVNIGSHNTEQWIASSSKTNQGSSTADVLGNGDVVITYTSPSVVHTITVPKTNVIEIIRTRQVKR